jgi:hypothetical protein
MLQIGSIRRWVLLLAQSVRHESENLAHCQTQHQEFHKSHLVETNLPGFHRKFTPHVRGDAHLDLSRSRRKFQSATSPQVKPPMLRKRDPAWSAGASQKRHTQACFVYARMSEFFVGRQAASARFMILAAIP